MVIEVGLFFVCVVSCSFHCSIPHWLIWSPLSEKSSALWCIRKMVEEIRSSDSIHTQLALRTSCRRVGDHFRITHWLIVLLLLAHAPILHCHQNRFSLHLRVGAVTFLVKGTPVHFTVGQGNNFFMYFICGIQAELKPFLRNVFVSYLWFAKDIFKSNKSLDKVKIFSFFYLVGCWINETS